MELGHSLEPTSPTTPPSYIAATNSGCFMLQTEGKYAKFTKSSSNPASLTTSIETGNSNYVKLSVRCVRE